VVFISDRPPSLKANDPLKDHTLVYWIIFSTKQPIGTSLLLSFPGQISWLSPFGLCLQDFGEFHNNNVTKHYTVNCGKTCKTRLRSTTLAGTSQPAKISLPQLPFYDTCIF